MLRMRGTSQLGGLAIAGLLSLAALPALAEQAPNGMVPYEHPIFHNGHRVLWHGAWRAGGGGYVGRKHARNLPGLAPAAAPAHELWVLADYEDANASRMAGELILALQSAGLKARAVVGQTSPNGLAKAVAGDSADLAIAPMDALLAADAPTASWKERAPYIARLGNETIEIVAPRTVATLSQLNGKRVSFGPLDSADGATAETLFARLGVNPKPIRAPLGVSFDDLAAGRIDAVVVAGAGNSQAVADFGKDGRFHLISIPWSPALRDAYAPALLTAKERPNLVGPNEKVDIVAAPMALIAIDAPPDSPRAAQLSPAVKAFFEKFDALLLAPTMDASWRDVNLAATANWPRLSIAQDWIANNRGAADASFEKFRSIAHSIASTNGGPGAADADRLYQSLMQWRGADQ